jgi:hypothetical protein
LVLAGNVSEKPCADDTLFVRSRRHVHLVTGLPPVHDPPNVTFPPAAGSDADGVTPIWHPAGAAVAPPTQETAAFDNVPLVAAVAA